MGCGHSCDASQSITPRRRYAKRLEDRERRRQQRLERAFADEARTSANAAACRRRFEEHRDELDRQSLDSLERSRSCNSSSGGRGGGCTPVISQCQMSSDSCFVTHAPNGPVATGTRSLVELFRVHEAATCERLPVPEAPLRPDPSDAPLNVFDLIVSESSHDADGGSDAGFDDGNPLCDSALPSMVVLVDDQGRSARTLSMPGLVGDDDLTSDASSRSGHSASSRSQQRHPLTIRGRQVRVGGSPQRSRASTSGSSSSRHSKASNGLESLRVKLLCPA